MGVGLEHVGEGLGYQDGHWALLTLLLRGGLSTVPVRAVMMILEKSSKGTLELVEKMMFIRMMQRMKLVTLATRRKAQARSSKSGEGREAGTPGQALRPRTWRGEGLQGA